MAYAILGQTPFAVVDVETTGVYAGQYDRIIEIAIVRLRPDLSVEDEWSTLVNPKRDIGKTEIHGIRAGDVLAAPPFEEIAADAGSRLREAIIVGHHLRFDLNFLHHEYRRCGVVFPEAPGLCTLGLAYQLLPDAPSRKLGYCCEQVGIPHEDEHSALSDASATAHLLTQFIDLGSRHGLTTLEALGCKPLSMPLGEWLAGRIPSGKALGRSQAAGRRREEQSYLARLIERMPGDEARNAREAEYLALVDRALEDRRITEKEASLLVDMAESWGMTRDDVLAAHRAYLASLVSEALSDGVVTVSEREDLSTVCDVLGLHRAALDSLLTGDSRRSPAPAEKAQSESLRGKLVCFTGDLLKRIDGDAISRETAHRLAIEAGVGVRESVTKTLDILVVADPDTQSLKAKKARQYGIRIMAEAAFWRAIGVRVD